MFKDVNFLQMHRIETALSTFLRYYFKTFEKDLFFRVIALCSIYATQRKCYMI